MARITAQNLQELRIGDLIKAEEWNAVVRAVRGMGNMNDGVSEEGAYANAHKFQTRRRTQVGRSRDVTIPKYSVFGVCEVEPNPLTGAVFIEQIGSSTTAYGSAVQLFTNGVDPILRGGEGPIWPVDHFDVLKLRVTGTAPGIGQPCGVVMDTFGVSAGAYGFVCIGGALFDVVAPFQEYAQVINAREPGTFLMRVTTELSAAGEVAASSSSSSSSGSRFEDSVLGLGEAAIIYRWDGSTGKLRLAGDPTTRTTPWELPVWNISTSAVRVGTMILATSVVGVGLVALGVIGGVTSTEIVHFRLESELRVGQCAYARLFDPVLMRTLAGRPVFVMDDLRMHFGPGSIAPSGDVGGDPRGQMDFVDAATALDGAAIGCAVRIAVNFNELERDHLDYSTEERRCVNFEVDDAGEDTFVPPGAPAIYPQREDVREYYSIVRMETWARWVEGALSAGQETTPWRVYFSDVTYFFDGTMIRPDGDDETLGQYFTIDPGCAGITPADGAHFKAVLRTPKDPTADIEYVLTTYCCP